MTQPVNIAYQSDAIAAYFSRHRRRWEQFYPSERRMFEQVAATPGGFGRVLDVGCAAGGLAAALAERRPPDHYVGVDISPPAIAAARTARDIPAACEFLTADIAATDNAAGDALAGRTFDTVFNLSCADWNVDVDGILAASWRHVAPGGRMIVSLRLTDGPGERRMERSFQLISDGETPPGADAERAAYIVLNVGEALATLGGLGPERVDAYGYWGKPSATARTPFSEILFAVFVVHRPADGAPAERAAFNLDLPADAWARRLASAPALL